MNTQNVSTNSISMLSSADSNMLFGGEANAIILDNQEMKNTQGFGFWISLGDFFKNPLNDLAVIGVGTFCVLTAFSKRRCKKQVISDLSKMTES